MMQEKEKWDALLVIKMDRIHRNARNFMEMMDNLQKWGKDFVSATESLDTSTAMGRFVMDIIQRIAQLESEQIGERVYMGMSQKAKNGVGILGSPTPYGYALIDGRYSIIESEADIIREIFRRYCDGDSLEDLRRILERKGVVTRNGKKWSKMSLALILHNPVYIGRIRWDHYTRDGNHAAIIDIETFDEVQRISSSRLRNRPHSKPHGTSVESNDSLARQTATTQEG